MTGKKTVSVENPKKTVLRQRGIFDYPVSALEISII